MSAGDVTTLLAASLSLAAALIALAALAARSVFVACLHLAGAGALAAAAIAAWRAPDAALAAALVGVIWAPLLLFGAMMLSARTIVAPKRRAPLASIVAAAAVAALIAVPVFSLPHQPAVTAPNAQAFGFWLVPFVAVLGAACVALLGYSERGALGGGETPP